VETYGWLCCYTVAYLSGKVSRHPTVKRLIISAA
jgi:hypothetical protein